MTSTWHVYDSTGTITVTAGGGEECCEFSAWSLVFHRILQIGINKEVVNLGGEWVARTGNILLEKIWSFLFGLNKATTNGSFIHWFMVVGEKMVGGRM